VTADDGAGGDLRGASRDFIPSEDVGDEPNINLSQLPASRDLANLSKGLQKHTATVHRNKGARRQRSNSFNKRNGGRSQEHDDLMNDAGQTLQVNHQDGLMNGEASERQNTQNT